MIVVKKQYEAEVFDDFYNIIFVKEKLISLTSIEK